MTTTASSCRHIHVVFLVQHKVENERIFNILPQGPPALALQPLATLGVIMSNVVCVRVCALALADAFARPTPPRCGHDPPAEMLLLARLLFRSTSAQVLLPCAPSLGRLREEIL